MVANPDSGSRVARARSVALVVPLLVGAVWAAALDVFGMLRFQRLSLPAFDNAYFQQLVWGIFHGHAFHASFVHGNFLGVHFSPLLVLPGALELAWPGFQTLNFLSALALGAVAPAAFLACRAIAPRSVAGTWLAVLVAVVLPFTPPLQEAGWSGFHTEELALPAILLATWAGLAGRWKLMLPLVLVALLAKEDQVYAVAVLGLLLWHTAHRRRLGASLITVALGWAVLVVFVAMPWLRHGGATDVAGYYSWLVSGGPGAIFSLGRLGEIAMAMVNPDAWRVLGLTVFALCLLPLFRPGFALLALPPLLAATLSRHQPQPHLQLQYALPIVYPLVLAAALGGRRVFEINTPRRAILAAALVPGLAVALLGSLLLPLTSYITQPDGEALSSVSLAMQLVPAGAELDTDDSLATAVASRANLHLLPHVAPTAFVLVDTLARPPQYAAGAERDRAVVSLSIDRRLLWSDGRLQLWSPTVGESALTSGVAFQSMSPHDRHPPAA